MYIHIIYFSYFYKNTPDVVVEDQLICPVATSTEARLYFWYHIFEIREMELTEVDSIRILQVQSTFVSV